MIAKQRSEIMSHIHQLKAKLQDWKSRPIVPEAVREIGIRAISDELSRISQELRLDDIHHRKY